MVAPVPPTADAGLRGRLATLILLRHATLQQLPSQASTWVLYFRVTTMFQKQKQALKCRVAMNFKGTVALPKGDEAQGLFDRTAEAAKANNKEALDVLAGQYMEISEGVPEAPMGKRPVPVDRLLASVACGMGGTMLQGAPPRGGLAYKLKRRGTQK